MRLVLLQRPWFRALITYVLLVVLFISYGHLRFYHDPGSVFFDESRAYERVYSAYREREVRQYMDQVQAGSVNIPAKAMSDPQICAAFLSVKRQGEQYLPLSAASSLQGLTSCERKDLHLDILLAHTNTSEHPSSNSAWLSNIVDSVHGYDVSAEKVEEIRMLEKQQDFSKKAIIDYTSALQSCYDTGAPWVVILEDDVLLGDGWLVQTLQAARDVEQRFGASDHDWLFMRLFNQERSIGWASRTPGGNHEALISFAVLVPVYFVLVFFRSKSSVCRRHLDNGSIAIICILAIPTFIVLFFQAGKASMLPPRPGVHNEPFGCCSQALLFPRFQVRRAQEYLRERKSGQIDMMLDELAEQDKLDRYALYPVQLQHIGQQSVRGTVAHEAQAIWSMAFEQQDPKRLRTTHEQLVRDMYGIDCSKS